LGPMGVVQLQECDPGTLKWGKANITFYQEVIGEFLV
jgi:hypothetical protein